MITIATRKSPLALVQTEMVAALVRERLGEEPRLLKIVTIGDKRTGWSLEEKGGKGLFTGELEAALKRGEADIAVHSTKDLPGESTEGLAVAGYLPRENPRDVLVIREGLNRPGTIATGSPRRRFQASKLFPECDFCEIRGNVDTRLKKIAEKQADATILAAAGLKRLGIHSWPGLVFKQFTLDEMVPAVGQGAIGIQCRVGDAGRFAPLLDAATARTVALERAFQAALGGGCHTAFAAHVSGSTLRLFHEHIGLERRELNHADFEAPAETARKVLASVGLI